MFYFPFVIYTIETYGNIRLHTIYVLQHSDVTILAGAIIIMKGGRFFQTLEGVSILNLSHTTKYRLFMLYKCWICYFLQVWEEAGRGIFVAVKPRG